MANPLQALTIIVFIVIVHEGETVKCWHCESFGESGHGCDDPFLGSSTHDKYFTRDCGSNQDLKELLADGTTPNSNVYRLNAFCYKLTGKVLGRTIVKRGCVSSLRKVTETSCMNWNTQVHSHSIAQWIKTETCDVCRSDLCNGAANVVETIFVLFASFLLLLT